VSPFIVSHAPHKASSAPPSSCAVGSLEEARRKAAEITLPYALALQPVEDRALVAAVDALGESGGSFDLPDGSRVTVEPWSIERCVEWLVEHDGLTDAVLRDLSSAEITDRFLAAWNREHGSHDG
jgi:hypothetical protein